MNKSILCNLLLTMLASTCNVALAASYKIVELESLGGSFTWAQAINERGQIVGYEQGTSVQYALIWDQNSVDKLDGSGRTLAFDINEHGQIAGTIDSNASEWDNGEVVTLS